MSSVKVIFLNLGDGEIDPRDEWRLFVDELEVRPGVVVTRVDDLDAVPGDGFVIVPTTHPEMLLDAASPDQRAKLASRLVPLGISRSNSRTLEMLELLGLPAAIKGTPEGYRARLTIRGLGLYGRLDIGEAIGAPLDFSRLTNYGFLEREPHDLAALLADYLTAYDARSRATVGDTGR